MRILLMLLVFVSIVSEAQAQSISGKESDKDTIIATYVDEQPVFDIDYHQFLKENVRYPDSSKTVQGRVFVKFVVELDGSISNPELLRGQDPAFDKEALRVAKLTSGHWHPAKLEGKKVRCYKILDVNFISPKLLGTINDSTTYLWVDKPAEFKGDYTKFLKSNLKYPKDAIKNKIEGTVRVKFVVEKDGSINNITIVRGIYPSLDEEALRVVKLTAEKWRQGKHEGNSVRTWKNLSIEFKLLR